MYAVRYRSASPVPPVNLPKHPRASFFAKKGLFNNLQTFAELEGRIAAIPSERERGEAFEVFAEAYLAISKTNQAKHVWPFEALPLNIGRLFRLADRDMGIDGIVETELGEYAAYQSKFRVGRPALTWTELSTFLALADYVPHRILFTNCDDVSPLLSERKGLHCVRGADLDELDREALQGISEWLKGHLIEQVRKEPRPHQLVAVNKITTNLGQYNRATAVMACGTGKTLVQLWSAERLKCKQILVLVPSLALLRQSLHEWLRETRWPRVSFLAVCSDPTVVDLHDDAIALHQADLDFPVTTEARSVAKFLRRPFAGVKIVFSTYQSSPVVARGMSRKEWFDIGVFDEAHKTAGRVGVRFGFPLKDSNLRIRKRLFMTATPRHYELKKAGGDDARLVYSMDDPAVYGPIVYRLSFPEAIRKRLICDYKVILSVVLDADVAKHVQNGEVLVDDSIIRARQVANQIALKKAVKKAKVSKIFTFHKSVQSARSFTAPPPEGILAHLGSFEALHVNGTMRTADREKQMRAFREAGRAVMSNARCLTEGVDVPTVDMVAFMAAKRSRVDVVQAVGRALRASPGKERGFILLPLLLERASKESVESAVVRARFDEVWDVLQAMQEQDDLLADIVRTMREEKGRTGGFDDSRFRERIVIIGPYISLDALRRAITTLCIEQLGRSWDEMYGRLEKFRQAHGHCNVPQSFADRRLWNWLGFQRQRKIKGEISGERIARLERLGVDWNPFESAWEQRLAEYVAHKKRFGHKSSRGISPRLYHWVEIQRRDRNNGQLSKDRIKRLNSIGFTWDPSGDRWRIALEKYASASKGTRLTKPFMHWASKQRSLKRQGKLPRERIRQLDSIRFSWDPRASAWPDQYRNLLKYRKLYGHCNVPQKDSKYRRLASWVNTQRQAHKRGELAADRKHKLDVIGFVWQPRRGWWYQRYSELVQFKKEHGHVDVPANNPRYSALWHWVGLQRSLRRHQTKKLPKERERLLRKLGIAWDPIESQWLRYFEALKGFQKKYGHSLIPFTYLSGDERLKLGHWVNSQREAYKNGALSSKRIQMLERLGFHWRVKLTRMEALINARAIRKKEPFQKTQKRNRRTSSNAISREL